MRYSKRFKAYLDSQEVAVAKLVGWMQEERWCLLCYEEDFNFCHRSFVADKTAAAVEGDVKINHLTGPMKNRVVVRRLMAA